jgi:hypothetical protein
VTEYLDSGSPRRAGSPCSRGSLTSKARGVCDPLLGGRGGDMTGLSSVFILIIDLFLPLHILSVFISITHILYIPLNILPLPT